MANEHKGIALVSLGIVAIIAVVGLVLLFTSAQFPTGKGIYGITGKAYGKWITAKVTCRFLNSNVDTRCYALSPAVSPGCTGTKASEFTCDTTVTGEAGSLVKLRSTCGDVRSFKLTGLKQKLMFKCPSVAAPAPATTTINGVMAINQVNEFVIQNIRYTIKLITMNQYAESVILLTKGSEFDQKSLPPGQTVTSSMLRLKVTHNGMTSERALIYTVTSY